jgi:hypothetical protein
MMGVPPVSTRPSCNCSNVIFSNGDPEYVPEGTDPALAMIDAAATLTGIMEEVGKYRASNPSTTSPAPW